MTKNRCLSGRFDGLHYWFGEADLIKHFGVVPTRINLDAIRARERAVKTENYRKAVPVFKTRYTVIQTLKDGSEVGFENVFDCAQKLGMSVSGVKNAIHKKTKRGLRYGEKQRQAIR